MGADNIIKNWKTNLYGGNKGAAKGNFPKTTGIVKHVWCDRSEEEIKEEISSNYDCNDIDVFKRNGKYMGIIKINFKTKEQFEAVMNVRITIFDQRYILEEYNF